MSRNPPPTTVVQPDLADLNDYVQADGSIVIPDGITLTSFFDRNRRVLGDSPSYRFVDYAKDHDGRTVDMSWNQLWTRVRAIGARLQQVTRPGDRVAIVAPQGVEYVAAFFAAVHAGNVSVPLFAPTLSGHAERLTAVLTDARPTVVLTTTAAAESVREFLRTHPVAGRPRMIAVDAIPDTLASMFTEPAVSTDDLAYLQYTSGSTRIPAGVEITHRAVCTNVVQMILGAGLDRGIRSVSWLPLYHDMGLLMLMFPALGGGYLVMLDPMAFVRRPYRWLKQLSAEAAYGRTFAAAPNFAYELAAERGLPPAGQTIDLTNVVGLLNGSEPVTIAAIEKFTKAFEPYGLPRNAVKPSYGMAEATLGVTTLAPSDTASAVYFDRAELAEGRAVVVAPDNPGAVAHVSPGPVLPDLWAVITTTEGAEAADGQVGEIWLHGNNIGRGYFRREAETQRTFGNKLQSRLEVGSHAEGAPDNGCWLATGDLGVYVDGKLYLTGRAKDLIIVDGRNHYPHDIETTVSQSSKAIRAGYVAAFSVPADALDSPDGSAAEQLVVVAERAAGVGRTDPSEVEAAVRAAVSREHHLRLADLRLVAAGSIPRTTSGKLARNACRNEYLAGRFSR
ncbi:fatty acyl-AMP ligase [Mycobacterium shigaense]|uniref:Nitrate ABC transporter substrate-binding protein n=1 Tax=Mycobacterium shigaense TaxID=722731 RepID=A0A1Z4ELF8_9MYCO|nr:fatty acyl-AMP ligase [Mycobacterium shigaense]MEA1121141.1 fatty acyl-AMP ligase [Mycobacterium shigaense]PRI14510.1 fatty-acid--CoA ligase [Mycobacterium shigaense]BAX93752.1 nitrate ABC transporter substrate-binding protein [Mycobacterium shigaense]